MANLVDHMMLLVGKRSDSAEVLRFHEDEGLAPPPPVFNRDLAYDMKHPARHYAMYYTAEVKLEGFYPPRRENGQYVAYLSNVELGPEFSEPLVNRATTKLSEKEAKARAIASTKNEYGRFHIIHREGGCTVTMIYDSDKPRIGNSKGR